MAKSVQTPGVYINEIDAFGNSIVPVPTAVPAFIGYTEKALLDKKDLTHVPVRISSLADYHFYFGAAPKPIYKFKSAKNAKTFELVEPNGRYLLYDALQLFFVNGGSDCYIVSIGNYSTPVHKDDMDGEALDAQQKIVLKGIRALTKEQEPTLVVIPDAVLLSAEDCAAIQRAMLEHCGTLRNRMAILDVHNGFNPDPKSAAIEQFRASVVDHLQWGAAYYPWLHTTITSLDALDFTSIEETSRTDLMAALIAEVDASKLDIQHANALKAEINKISTAKKDEISLVHKTLLTISPLYKAVMVSLLEQINLLPPSAGIAGIYAQIDNNIGVFHAPVNVSINSVRQPAIEITDEIQEDLNTPLSGKAVNAIRAFTGKGTLIWGARTLHGDNLDWRYIPIRRTVIFIEQSIKYGIARYVFSPNTAATWINVNAMITNFLTNLWQQGGLAGATPKEAFAVAIGLGETMTSVDVLDGKMRILVSVALTRPAEFMVISMEQQMQQS
jgi:phage tail sheath protein FI